MTLKINADEKKEKNTSEEGVNLSVLHCYCRYYCHHAISDVSTNVGEIKRITLISSQSIYQLE
jgi:hypothetical protein